MVRVTAIVSLALGATLAATQAPSAAMIAVNTVADELNTDGDCSLREAIRAANTDAAVDACAAGSGADTIVLPGGTYLLTIAGVGEEAGLTGDLDVTGELRLDGAGVSATTVDGGQLDTVFHIQPGASATLSKLTITNARTGGYPGGINNRGTLHVSECAVVGNVGSSGGGIWSDGALTIDHCTIDGNTAQLNGGGIYGAGPLTLTASTISGNTATMFSGGGILMNHSAAKAATLVNVTVSGNRAGLDGGGIHLLDGGADLANVTLTGNTADFDGNGTGRGGGITNPASYVVGIRNSIIAANHDGGSAAPDCDGQYLSQGYNLIGDGTACTGFSNGVNGDQVGTTASPVDPKLGALGNNGGASETHAPLRGSPAIDGGNPAGCADPANLPLALDQRDSARSVDGDKDRDAVCDIGAMELSKPPVPLLVLPRDGKNIKRARVLLDWSDSPSATSYRLEVRQGSTGGPAVVDTKTTTSQLRTPALPGGGTTYHWRARACNAAGCRRWTAFRDFTVTAP